MEISIDEDKNPVPIKESNMTPDLELELSTLAASQDPNTNLHGNDSRVSLGISDYSFPDLPTNEEEWNSIGLTTASDRKLTLKESCRIWDMLLENVHVCEEPNYSWLFGITQAIDSLRIPAGYTNHLDKTFNIWTYLEQVYDKLINKTLTYDDVTSVLELAKYKFGKSYSVCGEYYDTIRKCEKKLLEGNNEPKETITNKLGDLYQEQFSQPYLHLEADYTKFRSWAKQVNLDKNRIYQIQTLAYQMTDASAQLIETYPSSYLQFSHFECYVGQLLEKDPPDMATIESFCQEVQVFKQNEYNLNYCLVHAHALNSDKFSANPNRNNKLFKILTEGISETENCNGLASRFLEYALLTASHRLSWEQFRELVGAINEVVTLTRSHSTVWFASRRSIILATKTMIHKHPTRIDEFKTLFEEALSPVKLDYYEKDFLPRECFLAVDSKGFELKFVELLELWLKFEARLRSWTTEQVLNMWNGFFTENTNSITLLAYTNFIKTHGSSEELEAAYKDTSRRLEMLEFSQFKTYMARRSHLQLLANHLELKVAQASDIEVVETLSYQLAYQQAVYTEQFSEVYDLSCAVHVEQQGFLEIPQTYRSSTSTAGRRSQESVTSSDLSTAPQETELEVGNGFPIFVSRLTQSHTIEEIKEAFKEHNVEILKIDWSKNPRGAERGWATLWLSTEVAVEYCLDNLNNTPILGTNVAFLRHKTDRNYVPKSVQHRRDVRTPKSTNSNTSQNSPRDSPSTLLMVHKIPNDWQNVERLQKEIQQFGHVKKITLEEDKSSARLEFHMPEDCNLVYNLWEDKIVFQNLPIKIRKGFMAKQKPMKRRRDGRNVSHQLGAGDDALRSSQSDESVLAKRVARQSPFPQFVPQQIRTSMRRRLDVESGKKQPQPGDFSTVREPVRIRSEESVKSHGTLSSSSPSDESVAASTLSNLSNSDFRNMLTISKSEPSPVAEEPREKDTTEDK